MILYHGSDQVVEHPDIWHSQQFLDFGRGFYTTSVKMQAVKWSRRKATLSHRQSGIVNVYEFAIKPGFKVLNFGNDLEKWMKFVCACREGAKIYQKYDVIMGKVADDKVFRVVDMYRRRVWGIRRAIREFKFYETYNQTAFVSQEAIDAMLTFKTYAEIAL